MGLLRYLRGDDVLENGRAESRTLSPSTSTRPFLVTGGFRELLPPSPGMDAYRDVTPEAGLRVHEAWSCIRALADAAASLPLHVFRRQENGSSVRAGDDTLAVKLLRTPAPGLTTAPFVSHLMCMLNLYGEAFVAKYRNGPGPVQQLGLLHPDAIEIELKAGRPRYTVTRDGRRSEHGIEDILHIRGMSLDGLRGLSPVRRRLARSACRAT